MKGCEDLKCYQAPLKGSYHRMTAGLARKWPQNGAKHVKESLLLHLICGVEIPRRKEDLKI